MISVNRGEDTKPDGFDERSVQWFAEYQLRLKAGKVKSISDFWSASRRKLQADAEALQGVFHEKCAYCEARMSHVSRPHIEHYRPKSRKEFETLAYTWTNWLLSCGRCNEAKWAHFPDCEGAPCLIDPTFEEPQDHVSFVEHRVVGLTPRGIKTIEMLGLARVPLDEERQQWLLQVNLLLLLASAVPPVQEARTLLVWSLQNDAPYAAMTRLHIRRKAPLLANPSEPHPLVDVDYPRQRVRDLIEQNISRLESLS